MTQKINLDGLEYNLEDLSNDGKLTLQSLKFTTLRIQELTNLQALLQRAKNSYINSLKKEMISEKAGILLIDE